MSELILYRQTALPAFQNKIYATPEDARSATLGDVELVQDPISGLVRNRAFDASLLGYDEEYQNEQAFSATFREHLQVVLTTLRRHIGPEETGIEIGCGKGYFLEMMLAAGANIRGYDPSYQGSNPRVLREYFGVTHAPPPDYVVLRHVLEHIQSPWDFLDKVRSQCRGDTKIYIEVPCFDWVVDNRAFYDIFYEHVNYFTVESLGNAFDGQYELGHLFGGQYLYAVACLGDFRVPGRFSGKRFGPLSLDAYLLELLAKRENPPRPLYVWGAGAKGVTFSNLLVRAGIEIAALVDINPAKQGRFAGGTGLAIVSPDALINAPAMDIFVMNPIYVPEIRELLAAAGVTANVIPVA